MIIGGASLLEKNKDYVDELNVFPVPDGDTGTNMSLTVMAAAKEVQKVESDKVEDVGKALSSGALRGARGNSGVILSQLFRGFYKGLIGVESIDTTVLANAFEKGVATAYKAVMKPKEGTILTVAREGAEKAMQLALDSNDIEFVLEETIKYSEEVLQKTPDMLPVLKQAGVVDAGGQGLLFILKGALAVLKGEEIENLIVEEAPVKKARPQEMIDPKDIKFGYCTEFIINTNKEFQEELQFRDFLESIGDSVVVVCDDDIIKIHVHTNDPGNALQKGLEYGQLTNIKIDNMREQHESQLNIDENETVQPTELKDVGFIAVSIGEGLKEIFKGLGVDYIIEGGQTMNPSTEDILKAVDQVHAKDVFILPNNKNIILAADQAAKLVEGKALHVVPSKSIPQGIAALINFDENSSAINNYDNMKDCLDDVHTGQVTFAVRDTMIDDKEIEKDDILGIGDNKIMVVGKGLEESTKDLFDKLIDEDSELITIYYGEDVSEEDAMQIADYLEEEYDECEVEVHYGGQPLYYYIFSVE
ncbi:DAK2 domain-containing protein [Vallitalea okinawensis]|uniref:DAK2 domain-containing protein n=1 Tax=Vallitalea okinawensis TaxID=2078660 RepID=UPI000CFD04DB